MITIPTNLASGATASASAILGDPGMLAIILAVIALPVAFWVIVKVVGLFPGKLIGKGYDEMDRPFWVRRRGKRTYRDYIDKGL